MTDKIFFYQMMTSKSTKLLIKINPSLFHLCIIWATPQMAGLKLLAAQPNHDNSEMKGGMLP